jgi:hypothetical protein
MYRSQQKQVKRARLPYYGINKYVQRDRTVPNNKPDIIMQGNEERKCTLIDVEIPGDRNVIKKEAEKILKYKDLAQKYRECGT